MTPRRPQPGERWKHRASGQINLIMHLGEMRFAEQTVGNNAHKKGNFTLRLTWLPSVTYRIEGLKGDHPKTKLLTEFIEQCELVGEEVK